MAVSEQNTTINNQQVRYYEDGIHHGRSILLIHGGIGDAKHNWAGTIESLAKEYHVLAPDLPSFGGTDGLDSGSNLNGLVKWLNAFLDSQGIDQVAVIGNGFGALVARLMASQHPDIVSATVLINGGFIPEMPSFAKTLMKLPIIGNILTNYIARSATSDESLHELIHHPEALTPELTANIRDNLSGYASLMQMIAATPFTSKYKPQTPMLIIWGLADESVSPNAGQKLRSTLTGTKYVDIEGCGHLPHLEEPDIFDWQVKQFLTKQ